MHFSFLTIRKKYINQILGKPLEKEECKLCEIWGLILIFLSKLLGLLSVSSILINKSQSFFVAFAS